jgi:hypothetical protein
MDTRRATITDKPLPCTSTTHWHPTLRTPMDVGSRQSLLTPRTAILDRIFLSRFIGNVRAHSSSHAIHQLIRSVKTRNPSHCLSVAAFQHHRAEVQKVVHVLRVERPVPLAKCHIFLRWHLAESLVHCGIICVVEGTPSFAYLEKEYPRHPMTRVGFLQGALATQLLMQNSYVHMCKEMTLPKRTLVSRSSCIHS